MNEEKKLFYIRKIVPILYTVAASLMCLYITLHIRRFLNLLFPVESGYFLAVLLILYLYAMHDISINYFVARHKWSTWLAGTSVFLILYFLIVMIFLDIVRAILYPLIKSYISKDNLYLLCSFICMIIVACITMYAMYKARIIKVKTVSIPCRHFSGSYTMVLLSDLHIGYYIGPSFLKQMAAKVNQLDPDIVVISGDTINAGNTKECPGIDQAAAILASIHSREGTFAITGNHDPASSDPEFLDFLTRSKIHLIDDTVYTNKHFHLAGRATRTRDRKPLKEILKNLSKDKPIFVLDHDPMGIREAVSEDTDLVMCGHTHKGQIFPLNLFVRLLYKKEEFWGVSRQDHTNVIVSAGTGYFSMPMRLGSDCEIICIQINE